MGGCYSATKRMMKDNDEAPAPQAAKDDIVAKEATPVESEPKEVTISEVVTTTPEVSDATSEVVADPVKDATIEVASAPKEDATSKVVGLVKETTTEMVVCVEEDATLKEESGFEVKTDGNITTNEVTVEAKVNDKSDEKETKKEEDGEEKKDGLNVGEDDSKLIEKKTPEDESGPKGEEAKEKEKVSNVIETKI